MVNDSISVIKRDGTKEKLDLDKIHRVLTWACEGINGVSISEIELKSQIKFFDGIKATEIHNTLTKTAADLITAETPNYQYVAARLMNFNLRKEVYGSTQPWPLKKLVEHNIGLGYYTKELLEWYSDEDWSKLNKVVKHDRDYNFAYGGMKQMLGKYLVQNRVTKERYETPQIAYILIAATLFHTYPKNTRLKYVKDYYDALSNWDISIPTPILAGVRTPTKQFSSCVLISADDSLESINATSSAIVNYVSKKAGIGINAGRIRPVGSEIRGGEAVHTGVTPFLKYFQSALKSCSQGSIRNGAATVYYPFWHAEFENLIVLKNNKGVEENRVRHMDYGVQLNRLAYQRLIEGKDLTLFSPAETPDLLEAFYSGDNDRFDALYEKYERSRKLKFKQKISAIELFSTLLEERVSTGRIYIQNIDHANNQGSFDQTKHPIEQSNLCCLSDNQKIVTRDGIKSVRELHASGEMIDLFDNEKWVSMKTPMSLLRKNEPVYRIYTKNGYTHDVTADHKVRVLTGKYYKKEWVWKEAQDLTEGDKICIQTNEGGYGEVNRPKEAFMLGLYHANGTQHNQSSDARKKRLGSDKLKNLDFERHQIPDWIWNGNKETISEYLRGLYIGDGSVQKINNTKSKFGDGIVISLTNINSQFLRDLQILLSNLGIKTTITKANGAKFKLLPDGNMCSESKRILITNKKSAILFNNLTGFVDYKGLSEDVSKASKSDNIRKYATFDKLEFISNQDVYCCEVDSEEHAFIANGIITKNCEIDLPTRPFNSLDDENGRIALCTLSAINWGNIKKPEDFEKPCEMAVRALDALLSYQEFPMIQAELATQEFRTLGVGIINLAYFLAKNNMKYDESAFDTVAEYMEAMSYYLIKASVDLAEEFGPCELWKETKYGQGIFPHDVRKKDIDEVANFKFAMPWDELRERIMKVGIRNATLMALMPSESSSQLSNATNGIEPPRALVSEKLSKDGITKQVVPEIHRLKNKYDLLWDQKSPDGYLRISCIIQAFVDQGISTNVSINPENYESGKVSINDLLRHLLEYYKYGGKQLYYHNTNDGATDETENDTLPDLPDDIDDADCESCKI